MRKGLLITIGAAMLMGVAACSSRPSGILPEKKMARIIADMNIAESVAESSGNDLRTDSAKDVLRQAIYLRNGVSQAEVDSSMRWYAFNMEKYVEVYDQAIEMIDRDIARTRTLAGAKGESTTMRSLVLDGDSVDVWPGMRFRQFGPAMPSDIIEFDMPLDRNWEKGDVYVLSARITGSAGPTEIAVAAQYQDGSKAYSTISTDGDGWKRIRLALDKDKTATDVYGYLRYDSGDEVAFVDSISLVRMRSDFRGASSVATGQKRYSGKYGR